MIIDVLIQEPYTTLVDEKQLRQAVEQTVSLFELEPDMEMSVVVDGDDILRALNFQFRGIDSTTDVLSFPAHVVDPDTGMNNLGDVIISYPKAAAQAESAHNSIEDEIVLLTVHGTLHLLGYDHATDEEKNEMWTLQAQVLKALGCTINKLPED